ncbi:CHASE2 domain-containing protein [Thalassobaculum sp.]|uniref:CHASE2 domain-containing protein n=1 Tax=Thalassobaculum sp. TaxID=2022740 RepID=UPI0032EF8200
MQGQQEDHGAVVWSVVRHRPRRNSIAELLRWLLKTPARRTIYRLSLVLSLWLALSTTDIAGLSSASNDAVHDAIMRFVASDPEQPRDGDVTVVLWTESATQQFVRHGLAQRAWPIEYGAHAELLYTLIDFRPRAIFLDFAFLDKREDEGFGYLKEALQAAADAKIPVYVSDLPEAGRNALQPTPPTPEPSEQPVVRFVPATISPEPVVRHYPISVGGGNSVAVAIYYDLWSDLWPDVRREMWSRDRLLDGVMTGSAERFGLHWYRSVHPATETYFGDIDPHSVWCLEFQNSLRSEGFRESAVDLASSVCELLHAWLFNRELAQKALAAPPVIPADSVVFEEPPPADPAHCNRLQPVDADPAKEVEKRRMWEFLSCRIVMVGSGLLASGDFRDTPLAPRQPSVLVHAQALQNLLDGNVYFKEPHWPEWLADSPGVRAELEKVGISRLAGVLFLVISVGLYSLHFESKARRRYGQHSTTLPHGPLALAAPGEAGFWSLLLLFLVCSTIAAAIASALVAGRIDPGGWGDAFTSFALVGAPVVLPGVDRLMLWAMYRETMDLSVGGRPPLLP